eukprot:9470535-Pyramimonas_sp.AAC.1
MRRTDRRRALAQHLAAAMHLLGSLSRGASRRAVKLTASTPFLAAPLSGALREHLATVPWPLQWAAARDAQ